jgi:hypothetical protein
LPVEILNITPEFAREHQAAADQAFLSDIKDTARNFEEHGITGVANQWLLSMPWKRCLAFRLFADLLESDQPQNRSVLEVGGSLSYFTYQLATRHNYILLESVTHEDQADYRHVENETGKSFLKIGDWADFEPETGHDVVIANDVFPNVDQRLYEFVDRFLPIAKELRLTLTYYEDTVFEVRRISSGEILTMKPWGLREMHHFVSHLATSYPQICGNLAVGDITYESYEGRLFSNRRNVVYLRITK